MLKTRTMRTTLKLRRQPRGLCVGGVGGSPALSGLPQRPDEILLYLFLFAPLLLCVLHEGQVLEG